MATIPWREVHERWMKDPAYRKAYEEAGPRMERKFAEAEAREKKRQQDRQSQSLERDKDVP